MTHDDGMVIDSVLFDHLPDQAVWRKTRLSTICKAQKVALRQEFLGSVITKEMTVENYEREQDKRACLERVENYQQKMVERTTVAPAGAGHYWRTCSSSNGLCGTIESNRRH